MLFDGVNNLIKETEEKISKDTRDEGDVLEG